MQRHRDALIDGQQKLAVEIQSVIRDKILQAVALAILERETSPSYDLVLPVGSAAALGEVFDPWFETPTKPREQLAELFGAMSGGSIGLSGPRGAGKTTLINHFCRRSDGGWRPHDQPVMAFATPAPARYEARDFVLHLFATLCQSVLAAKGDRFAPRHESDRPLPARSALSVLLPFSRYMFVVGLYIIVGSATLLALRTAVILWPSEFLQHLTGFLAQIGQALGLKLGPCFLLGGLLLLLGLGIRRSHVVEFRLARAQHNSSREYRSDLSQQAAAHLEVIHFQRSYTAGWSGTLTLPIGVAGSANEAQTLAERQESLPELINRYSDFVRQSRS
jgi:hypothetical protein